MRQEALSALTAGITRLRDKGGASPQSLYDLLNGYIDASGAPTSRDGTTVNAIMPAGTVGLCSFKGKLNVFAMSAIAMPAGYVCNILIHPTPGFAGTIAHIHFAKPFLGYLYVVAEFSDGSVYHYWLQQPSVWTAGTVYGLSSTVEPTVPNGFFYQTKTPINAPLWTPNTAYTVGSVIQPSTPNGYIYTVTSVAGTSPTSGTTEPVWPAQNGAQVFEEVDAALVPSSTTTPTAGSATVPPSVATRYGFLGVSQ